MTPKISVIVPVYNVEKFLPECLDSLVKQTYGNVEIICVNDGSRDGCGKILADYAAKYPQIKVITQENAGVSAARNRGMKEATGEYFMFVDADDRVDESICEELMTELEKEQADCVMCSYQKEYGNHSTVMHIYPQERIVWSDEDVKKNVLRRLFGLVGKETRHPEYIDLMVSPWQQLFKRELCQNVTFADLKEVGSGEDCLFQMEVYAKCRKFVYIDKPLYHYRKNNAASITTRYNPRLFARWQNLYNRMERLLCEEHYPEIYWTALTNRVLFGLIGLGLNEIAAKESIFWKSARFRYIFRQPRYRDGLRELDTSYMALPWKIFFYLAKHGHTFALTLMLMLIDYARKR